MNDSHKTTLPPPNVEQDTGDEPMGEERSKGLDTRVDILVVSYRATNHDPDGVSAKAAIDGIVRRGILQDDSAKEVREVRFRSYICKKGEEERTEIIIEDINQ